MLPIQGLKCIYDTTGRAWSIELVIRAEGEHAVRRFEVDSADDAEMLIEAFEDSSASAFDPETGEIIFGYEYLDLDELDEDGEEDEDEHGEADEEEEEDSDASEGGEKPKG